LTIKKERMMGLEMGWFRRRGVKAGSGLLTLLQLLLRTSGGVEGVEGVGGGAVLAVEEEREQSGPRRGGREDAMEAEGRGADGESEQEKGTREKEKINRG
jgi:hypothetical protein